MDAFKTDPDLMTPHRVRAQERQREIAVLLAHGFLRAQQRHVHSDEACGSHWAESLDSTGSEERSCGGQMVRSKQTFPETLHGQTQHRPRIDDSAQECRA